MQYFDHSSFPSIDDLISEKRKKGIKIGLALPTKNEGKTLGKTLDIAIKYNHLIDQIVVFDSGSTDSTEQICKDKGITFIKDQEFSKKINIPLKRGKGWNIWSSIIEMDVDIIGWIDTDITNINDNFIIGLFSPLVYNDKKIFNKCFYGRPKNDARVTELVVRPYLNLLFPELKNILQPLSGEYAAKRSVLTDLIYYSGYSIEVTILIQLIKKYSVKNIVQTNLGERLHELQSVSSLGEMSSSILRVLLIFSEKFERIKMNTKLSKTLRQFSSIKTKDGSFSHIDIDTEDCELPSPNNIKFNKD